MRSSSAPGRWASRSRGRWRKPGCETIVAEAQTAIGQGVSSRNSEVIHAGLYYAPGSLKARLCVRGKELLYALCASHGVNHRNCGKLVVANSEAEASALRGLRDRAVANGVPVDGWTRAQARELEPALQCVAALLSTSTGIVDSHGFMLALQGDLESAGGVVALGSAVDSAVLGAGGGPMWFAWRMAARSPRAFSSTRASLHACALARRFDGLDPETVPREYFAKGSYYALAGKAPFTRLVYPAPADAWLGVHLTLDLGWAGQVRPGPRMARVARPEEIDYTVDPRRADSFYAEVRRYWPYLPDGALQPSYSGVRPEDLRPGRDRARLPHRRAGAHGVARPGQLVGIESPGLTSSLAIAEHVNALLREVTS